MAFLIKPRLETCCLCSELKSEHWFRHHLSADDIHGAIEFATGFDIHRSGGDIPIHGSIFANGERTGAEDSSGNLRLNFSFFSVNKIEEGDICSLFDEESFAVNFSDDVSDGAEGCVTRSLDVGLDNALAADVTADDEISGKMTAFADEDVTTRLDSLVGGHVDLDVFE